MRRRQFLRGLTAVSACALSPPLLARQRALRVIVVGAGIVGASVAMHLAQAGARVTLLEMTGPAKGATGCRQSARTGSSSRCIPLQAKGFSLRQRMRI